jgi:beta-mannosidase
MRPKPAYYAIKRALAPISLGMTREVQQNRAHDRPRQFYEFGAYQSVSATLSVWAANSTLESRSVTLEVEFIDLGESGWTRKLEITRRVLGPNGSTELLEVEVPAPNGAKGPYAAGALVVIGSVLRDAESGEVIARAVDWPQPWISLQLPDPKVEMLVHEDHVVITVQKPVKGLWLYADENGEAHDEEVQWSDNGLDILPGERRVIKARKLRGRKVTVAYLGHEHATVL